MLSRIEIHNIVGIVGNLISAGLFLSPSPTFWNIYKKKSVEEFSPIPYLTTVLNCMLWVFYGLPFINPNSLLVVTINGAGLVLELLYLFIFMYYATAEGRKRVAGFLGAIVVLYAGFVSLILLLRHGTAQRSLIVGIVCVLVNIAMYMSPLIVMKKVITTKSVKYMPFTLSLVSFLNGLVWTSYGLIIFDTFLLISNGSGSFFGLIQLVLYGYYWKYGVQEVEGEGDQKVTKPSDVELARR